MVLFRLYDFLKSEQFADDFSFLVCNRGGLGLAEVEGHYTPDFESNKEYHARRKFSSGTQSFSSQS